MKRFIHAVTLVMALASAHAFAQQPASFHAAQNNHQGMMIPADPHIHCNPHATFGDKSESLGAPYYLRKPEPH